MNRTVITFLLLLMLLAPVSQAQGEAEQAVLGANDAEVGEAADVEGEAEVEVEEIPASVRSATRLLTQLDSVNEENRDLEQRMAKAQGEDLRVLAKENISQKLEFLELVGKLVSNLDEQTAAAVENAEHRATIERHVLELTPALIEHIDDIEENLGSLRNERDDKGPDELLGFEQRIADEIAWLDNVYGGYVDNVRHLEALELDAEKARADLGERLSKRTSLEAARVNLVLEELRRLKERAAEQGDDPALRAELAALNARRNTATGSLSKMVRQMDAVGLDATKYQQLLMTSTGEVTTDIFKPKVAIGLIQGFFDDAQGWVKDNGPSAIFKVLMFLVIVSIARLLSVITRRLMQHAFKRAQHASVLLQNMLVSVLSNFILLLGILLGLSQMGFELGPLLAGLGIAGFIIGFALQDSLSNFASGMLILGYRPFDVGDIIEAAGVRGTVHEMSLVNTTILTIDNRTLIVPNTKIWSDVITNLTTQDKRRVDLEFHLSYQNDVEHAEQVLMAVLKEHPMVLADPEPTVKVHKLSKYSVLFVARPWALTPDYWNVYWDLTRAVKIRLEEEAISIAIPRRMVEIQDDRQAPS
jgi:small conductance mechanosensitive channel